MPPLFLADSWGQPSGGGGCLFHTATARRPVSMHRLPRFHTHCARLCDILIQPAAAVRAPGVKNYD